MKKSGTAQGGGLKLNWEVDLDPRRAQLVELQNGTHVRAASRLSATATVAATWEGKGPGPTVGAGFINILIRDRKQISYRYIDRNRRTGHHVSTLTKTGPLWDPSDDAFRRRTEVFPFSQPPRVIALDGVPRAVTPFEDTPFVEMEKQSNGQELYWIDGMTVFMIILSVIVQKGDEQDEVNLFHHNWTIDWRLRPQVHGWAARGEPMVFSVPAESAEGSIAALQNNETANNTNPTQIESTWDNIHR
jgi:hypothetical protein